MADDDILAAERLKVGDCLMRGVPVPGVEQEADVGPADLADQVEALDERHSRVVELRFFGGMNMEEVAQVLGSPSGPPRGAGGWRGRGSTASWRRAKRIRGARLEP